MKNIKTIYYIYLFEVGRLKLNKDNMSNSGINYEQITDTF